MFEIQIASVTSPDGLQNIRLPTQHKRARQAGPLLGGLETPPDFLYLWRDRCDELGLLTSQFRNALFGRGASSHNSGQECGQSGCLSPEFGALTFRILHAALVRSKLLLKKGDSRMGIVLGLAISGEAARKIGVVKLLGQGQEALVVRLCDLEFLAAEAVNEELEDIGRCCRLH
jgi:hypothetical protein